MDALGLDLMLRYLDLIDWMMRTVELVECVAVNHSPVFLFEIQGGAAWKIERMRRALMLARFFLKGL